MKFITIILLILSLNSFAQESAIGISLKNSNMGIGSDIVYKFHNRMSARVGFDYFAYGRLFTFEQSDVTYDGNANIRLGSFSALYDFFLLPSIHVTAGAAFNRTNITFKGEATSSYPLGELEIPADRIGNFEFEVKPGLPISPYIGIGFGKTIGTKLLGFDFEIGTFYHGKPDITISSTGLTGPTSNPAHEHEKLMESQISQYVLYPVIRGSISFKIIEF
ncbi:MAG: hypothetical protein PF436_12480 [Prolixibacteraceae bacterium]|jgi:hypothetical protein|nr:hypothetical protein [Prolixibacteraceae bacterium]